MTSNFADALHRVNSDLLFALSNYCDKRSLNVKEIEDANAEQLIAYLDDDRRVTLTRLPSNGVEITVTIKNHIEKEIIIPK